MLFQVGFPSLTWDLVCRLGQVQVFLQVQVAKEVVLDQNSLMDLTFVILI